MQDNQNLDSGPSGASTDSEAQGQSPIKVDRRQTERRRHTRYPISATLEAVDLRSKARFTGRVSDLSLGGCYVDAITTLPVEAALKIRVTHDGKSFETRARVIVSSAGMGMGLIFTETENEQLEILEVWIRELSGETLPCEPELPGIKSAQPAEPGSNIAILSALNELIIELMQTGVLTDLKGNSILQRNSRR
jgi:hypothetical protein